MSRQGDWKTRVFGLDVLRAIAVLMVLLNHSLEMIEKPSRAVEDIIAPLTGYFGVEFFFVLSGFLIGRILLGDFEQGIGLRGLGRFWTRRWFRTLPNYYLFLGINVVIATVFWGRAINVGRFLLFSQCLLGITVPLATSATDPYADHLFGESWSLCIEEAFYLILPVYLIILATVGFRREKLFRVGFISFLLFGLLLRIYLAKSVLPDVELVGGATFARLDACMFGVLGALVSREFPIVWKRLRPIWGLGAALVIGQILLCACVGLEKLSPSLFFRTTFFSVTGIAVLCWLPALSRIREVQPGIITRGITWISLCSYSLYLCQHPLFFIIKEAELKHGGLRRVEIPLFVVSSIAAASLLYPYFEKPMTALREKFRGWGPSPSHESTDKVVSK